MIESGMAVMMKTLGLDPAEIKTHVEAFTSHMKAQAEAINANQQRIEEKLDRIEAKLDGHGIPATRELLDVNGKPTNVLITDERFPQAMIDDVNRSQRSVGEE